MPPWWQMKKYNIVLFDLDGTLTEPKEGITKSIRYALNKFGLDEENPQELVKFIGPPLQESFMKYYGFDEQKAWQAVLYYREYFSTRGIFENAVFAGIEDMLCELKQGGRKIVLATSKPTVYSVQILEHFGLAGYFNLVVGSNLDGSRIVKAEIIRDALAAVRSDERENPVMVGDRKHDIIGARFNGIDSIGVSYGYGSRTELQEAGASHIVDTVNELRHLLLNK